MIKNDINGETAVYGLIGSSVEYSLSPLIHNELARIMGINSVYNAFPVKEPSSIGKALEGAHALGIKGVNVTVPYKKSVVPYLCRIDDSAERIGAANTLKYTDNGYEGFNTDIAGICKTFERYGINLKKQSLLILGAGGGAASAAFAAALRGVKHIYIANRTNKNSEALASRIKKYYNNIDVSTVTYDEISNIKENYFILQATSVGMNSAFSPVDSLVVKNSTGVFDIIYSPPKTKILCQAESLGKLYINGIDMLIYQAVKAFEIWNEAETADEIAERLKACVSDYVNVKSEDE